MSKEYSLTELEELAELNWKKMKPYINWQLPVSYLTFSIYVHSGMDAVENLYNPWPPYSFLFLFTFFSVIGFFRKKPVPILKFPVSPQQNLKIVLIRILGFIILGGIIAGILWFNVVRGVFMPGPINLYSKTFGYLQAYLAMPIFVFCTVMILYSVPGVVKKSRFQGR